MALDGIIGQVRIDLADIDPVDPAISDAVLTAKINRNYLLYHEKVERRITEYAPTDAGLAAIATGIGPFILSDLSWYDVVAAYVNTTSASTIYGTPLEIVKFHDLIREHTTTPLATGPQKIAFVRSTVDTPTQWRAYIYPSRDPLVTTHISVVARRWPPLLSAPGDIPELTDAAAYIVAKLAAAECAPLLGEDQDFVNHILSNVPGEIFDQIGKPRPGFMAPAAEQEAA